MARFGFARMNNAAKPWAAVFAQVKKAVIARDLIAVLPH